MGTGSRTMYVAAALAATATLLPTIPAAQAHRAGDFRSERRHLSQRAHSQIGRPYRYGGGSPSGFDCSGLTRWVFSGHGATLPHSSQAQFEMGNDRGHRRIYQRDHLKVGDLVFHKTTSARVGHAGVYIGDGKFISSTSSSGVRVRSLYDSYWGPRWVAATRVPATMRYRH